jgi:predicted phosphodiesterase
VGEEERRNVSKKRRVSLRPIVRRLAPVIVGVVGAWLGMLVAGTTTLTTGPFSVELAGGFGHGLTDIALPPLGTLTADTHRAPLRLTATLQDVDVPKLTEVIRTSTPDEVVAEVERDTTRAILPFALRLVAVALLGGLAVGVLVFRTGWRRVGVATLAAILAVSGSELLAWTTFRPAAFLSPRFSGTLALAPDLIGPVETATDRINQFRGELRRVIDGAVRVFARIQSSPLVDGDEIRVLHVSDIHLSPLGLEFARELAEAFDVHFVIDTGDLTSFGTEAEDLIVSYVPQFRRPYVFVRGNHDSITLQAAMRRVGNAVVLDGATAAIEGLTVYGLGDPAFTPNPETAPDDDEQAQLFALAGERIASDLDRLSEPPDILAVHNDRIAGRAVGRVPLVIAGHDHVQSARQSAGTLLIRVGTTGGAGATVFTEVGGIPLSAQVLRFSASDPARLIAYDVIEQSPETGSLTVERHLVDQEFGAEETPSPTPTATATATASPSA